MYWSYRFVFTPAVDSSLSIHFLFLLQYAGLYSILHEFVF